MKLEIIKKYIFNTEYDTSFSDKGKIYIYCAMQLYLDFINIFLRILSIFGKRRN